MKVRVWLMTTAMIVLMFISAEAMTPSVPSLLVEEDKVVASAYYDTLGILSTNNECSDFFGGPASSVDVFKGLVSKAEKEYFPSTIGIQMSGGAVNVVNHESRKKSRIFRKVSLNANGPFFRKRNFMSEPFIPGIGSFGANTKEVRVLMLLHELGHVVEGEDGKWLLPDDGGDSSLSRDNTKKIEDVCGDQIRNLGKGDRPASFASGKQKLSDEDLALAAAKQ